MQTSHIDHDVGRSIWPLMKDGEGISDLDYVLLSLACAECVHWQEEREAPPLQSSRALGSPVA